MKKNIFLLLLFISSNAFSQNWREEMIVRTNDKSNGDVFGSSLAISGEYLIAGAQLEDDDVLGANSMSGAGSVYLFKNNAGAWTQVQKLVASDRDIEDNFGFRVDIYDDYAIVGAPNEDHDLLGLNFTSSAGAAYIFKNNNGTWSQVQKLVANDRSENDLFGNAVSIWGEYAFVAARDNNLTGAVYVFKNTAGTWTQVQKLNSADMSVSDWFGSAVSVSGNYAIIAASNKNELINNIIAPYAGAAYIFKNLSGTWTQIKKLAVADLAEGDRFGSSVDIVNEYAIVGAQVKDYNEAGVAMVNAGAAYIFKNNADAWSQVQKIVASDKDTSDLFGVSVAINDTHAIVGAFLEDEGEDSSSNKLPNAGSAYMFENIGGTWSELQKIIPAARTEADNFGIAVALQGEYAMVGAQYQDVEVPGQGIFYDAGSVYIFKNNVGVGFAEISTQSTVLLHPNPNTGSFQIQLSSNGADILIRNMLGQIISKTRTTERNIPLHIAEEGIYFVEVITEDGRVVERVLVQ